MSGPFDLLAADRREDILSDTLEPLGEGAWFAWREDRTVPGFDIRNGIWWAANGRAISLATGTNMHSWGGVDWETYAFDGAAEGCAEDVCCHPTREEADRCATIFLAEGRFCTDPATFATPRSDGGTDQ